MAEYHVGMGILRAAIYAGTLEPKNKRLWRNKSDCTEECIAAVRDYMVEQILGGFECEKAKSGGWSWELKDGRVVELTIAIKDREAKDERVR